MDTKEGQGLAELELQVRQELFSMQDKGYIEFQSKLIPTVKKGRVIGVRIPLLRKYTKGFVKQKEAMEYIKILPHQYYEENNLHAFIVETIKDYEQCVKEVDRFLPYVDNWATCDMMSPKVFKKHLDELLLPIQKWLAAKETYRIRFGIEMLMVHYLDEAFQPEYLKWVADVQSDEYYVNMMIAWYLATALAKQYEATLPLIEQNYLGLWVHNKTIQKAIESNRLTAEQKEYLRTLKRKTK